MWPRHPWDSPGILGIDKCEGVPESGIKYERREEMKRWTVVEHFDGIWGVRRDGKEIYRISWMKSRTAREIERLLNRIEALNTQESLAAREG